MKQSYALIISATVIFLTSLIGLEGMEESTLNLNFKIRGTGEAHKSILNFDIEEKEFFSYMAKQNKVREITFPFNKAYTENLLYWDSGFFTTLLSKISKYEPLLIVVVPTFSGSITDSTPDNHKRKLKEISKRTPILWGSTKDTDDNTISPSDFLTGGKVNLNNLISSTDLFVKKASVKNTLVGSILDSIESHDSFKDLKPSRLSNDFYINYISPEDSFETMSAVSFIKQPDKGWSPLIKNKIVFIDIKSKSTAKYMIPFPDNDKYALVSNGRIQREILNSILNGTEILRLPRASNILISLLLGLSMAFLFVKYKAVYALTLVMAITGSYLLIALLFFGSLSIWLNTVTPIFTAFITTLLMATWRYTTDERKKTFAMQQEIEKLKGNFLSLISHNLRTPIAKIRALSSVLLNKKSDNLTDDQVKGIKDVLKSSKDLTSYITNILNITRIESQRVKLNKSICDINVIIEHAVKKIQEMNETKKIKFDLKLEPIFSIELDKELFLQLFINILSNAINYSPTNSTITIESLEQNNLLYISVTDQGIGISKDDINNIFNKFYRAKNVYTESNTGTGLGLYLVQYFLKLHGGTIKADSVLGEGTTFTITLPIS